MADPSFTEADTLEAQTDWTKSTLHAFLRGARPSDPESQREANQIHLNVERIRIPEVIFQPSIAGVDQAGLIEIMEGIVLNRFSDPNQQKALLRNVFITGGNTLFAGFEERLASELRSVLPTDFSATVRRAQNPVLDAWKGAAGWWSGSSRGERASASVSRAEYDEKGSEYIKVCLSSIVGILCHCLQLRIFSWLADLQAGPFEGSRTDTGIFTGTQSRQLDSHGVWLRPIASESEMKLTSARSHHSRLELCPFPTSKAAHLPLELTSDRIRSDRPQWGIGGLR